MTDDSNDGKLLAYAKVHVSFDIVLPQPWVASEAISVIQERAKREALDAFQRMCSNRAGRDERITDFQLEHVEITLQVK